MPHVQSSDSRPILAGVLGRDPGRVDGRGNPNGSIRNIAGVFNESKTVLGLMPHPENAIEPIFGGTDGKALFEGMVESLS